MQTIVTVITAAINPFRRRFLCLCGYKTNKHSHFKNHIATHRNEIIDIKPVAA